MNVAQPVFTSPDEQVAWLGTDPIPAKAYYDPEWYELERQAIFRSPGCNRPRLRTARPRQLDPPRARIRQCLDPDRARQGHPDNLYGYPNNYSHRTQTIWSNPEPLIKPIQGYNMGLLVRQCMEQGIVGGPHDRTYFAAFPSLFVIGTPMQNFSHMVYPLGPTRPRGVIPVYWVSEDENATMRHTRE